MTDDQLAANPVFPLNPSGMNAAVISQSLQDELLAKGIPALSPPCGAGSVIGIGTNSNLTVFKSNGWGRQDANGNNPWLHSDIKNMAFYYTHSLFNNLLQ